MIANCPTCRAPVSVAPEGVGAPAQCPACQQRFLPGRRRTEGTRRRRNLAILGVVLLVLFFLPVPVADKYRDCGYRVGLPDIEALRQGVAWPIALLSLTPAIAGVVAILAALFPARVIRGFVLLLPVVLLGVGTAGLTEFVDRKSSLQAAATDPWLLLAMTQNLAPTVFFAVMLVGIRMRFYRPWAPSGYVLGCVGGGLFLLHMVLPFMGSGPAGLANSILGTYMGWLLQERTRWLGIYAMASAVCYIASALFCAVNHSARDESRIRTWAGTALGLLLVGPIAALAAVMASCVCYTCPGSEDRTAVWMALPWSLKTFLAFDAVVLLLPAGILDLLLGPPAREAARPTPP